VALVAALVIVAAVLWQRSNDAPVASPATTPSVSQKPTAKASSSPPASPSSTASSTPSAPSPEPSTPSSSKPTRSTAPGKGKPTAAELAQAITDYYALMPKGTDAAWPRLTKSYQISPSGGRAAYERFWGSIRSVSVSNVAGSPPKTATATVSYVFKDGRKSTDRTTFQLVRSGGILKINRSRVGG
jgi:hypothetical protein